MIDSYPAGLQGQVGFFRCLKSVFTQEVKDFLLLRMKASKNNIKPIVVIDDVTQDIEIYELDSTLQNLILFPNNNSNLRLRNQNKVISEWFVRKARAQISSNLNTQQKEVLIDLITMFLYHHKTLNQGQQTALAQLEALI